MRGGADPHTGGNFASSDPALMLRQLIMDAGSDLAILGPLTGGGQTDEESHAMAVATNPLAGHLLAGQREQLAPALPRLHLRGRRITPGRGAGNRVRDVARACGAGAGALTGDVPGTGRLFDVVFDCTGAADAFEGSLALVVPGGRVVMLGSYPSPISLQGIGRQASVVFSSVYRDEREFAGALRLLARRLIDVAALTTSVMPLTSYGEAFASLRDPERGQNLPGPGGGERRGGPVA